MIINKRKVKKITSYILSAVFAVCIVALVLAICVYSSIFDRNKLGDSLVESKYYLNIYKIVHENCSNYLLQSGFDENLFDNVITEESVKSDINDIINDIYENRKVEISTETLEQKLDQNIQKQIEEKEYTVDDEAQASIDEFKKTILETYENNILYSQKAVDQVSKYFRKAEKASKMLIIAAAMATSILAFIIFKLRKPAIGIGILAAGVLLVVAKVYSGVRVAINNILVINWAFSSTVSYILNKLVQNIFVVGVVLIVVGLLWIVIFEHRKSKKIFKYKNSNEKQK